MNKSIIHVFGASGSGTSTLARRIGDELGYFFMDADDYYWLPTQPPYTDKREIPERLALMRRDFDTHGKCVVAGSMTGWGDPFIPDLTLAVRLVTATDVRIERLKQRERKHFGSRLDEGGDMYENHLKFLDWAAAYDTGDVNMRSKANHDEWQKLLKCELITLDGAAPIDESMAVVRRCLGL